MEKITIVLPNGKEIKRVQYSKYIANNSPVWVIVKGIRFYIDYYNLNDMSDYRFILDCCVLDDFIKKYGEKYIYRSKSKYNETRLLHVENTKGYWNEYYNLINNNWFSDVK